MPLFGGNRGGRKRKDGFAPGSPEALAADKEKDRLRKLARRQAAAAVVEPPPLPSAIAGEPGPEPPPANAPSGVPPGAEPPPVPWNPADLREYTDEIIDACETSRVKKWTERAVEGQLPEPTVKQIGKDAHYPALAKKSLKLSAPGVVAKVLNKTGISSERRDEVGFVFGVLGIIAHGRRLESKLEELIETNKALLEQQRKAKP